MMAAIPVFLGMNSTSTEDLRRRTMLAMGIIVAVICLTIYLRRTQTAHVLTFSRFAITATS